MLTLAVANEKNNLSQIYHSKFSILILKINFNKKISDKRYL
jgi:hypothetical protein